MGLDSSDRREGSIKTLPVPSYGKCNFSLFRSALSNGCELTDCCYNRYKQLALVAEWYDPCSVTNRDPGRGTTTEVNGIIYKGVDTM